MQETRLEKKAADVMDYFFPVCVVGLALLGLGTGTQFGIRYTPW